MGKKILSGNTIIHEGKTSRDIMQITTSDINVDIKNGTLKNSSPRNTTKNVGLIIDNIRDKDDNIIKETKNVTVNINNVNMIMTDYKTYKNNDVIVVNGDCKKININVDGCYLTGAYDGIYFPAGGVGEEASRLNVNNTRIDDVQVLSLIHI